MAKLRGVNRIRSARALLLGALVTAPLAVQGAQDAPATTAATSEPPGAFTRVEAARFAGVIAIGGLAYLVDEPARDAIRGPATGSSGALNALSEFGYYYGEPGVAVLATAMWGVGLLSERPTLAVSGFRGMEAIAVSGLVTVILKELTGRARPEVPPHARDDWALRRAFGASGNDYKAMASGHATVAFAFATAVTQAVAQRAPERTRLVATTTFGLAALTAWQRMHDDRHWLSDVTVGAGIGSVTAMAITRWHATRPDNAIDRVFLRPILAPAPGGGMRLGLNVRTR